MYAGPRRPVLAVDRGRRRAGKRRTRPRVLYTRRGRAINGRGRIRRLRRATPGKLYGDGKHAVTHARVHDSSRPLPGALSLLPRNTTELPVQRLPLYRAGIIIFHYNKIILPPQPPPTPHPHSSAIYYRVSRRVIPTPDHYKPHPSPAPSHPQSRQHPRVPKFN